MIPSEVLDGLHMVGDTAFSGQSPLATAIGGAKTAERILGSPLASALSG